MFKAILTFATVQFLTALAFGSAPAKGIDVAYFDKLRFDFAARKDFSPGWDVDDARKAVLDAFKAGDYSKEKELGDAWLKKVPVDAEVYLVIALGRKEQGDLAGYSIYMAQFYGLLSSITSSGDGRSAETAYKVISVSEEYFLLRDIGAKLKQQSLVGSCDVMVVDQRGKEKVYYFDVRIPLEAERRELGMK